MENIMFEFQSGIKLATLFCVVLVLLNCFDDVVASEISVNKIPYCCSGGLNLKQLRKTELGRMSEIGSEKAKYINFEPFSEGRQNILHLVRSQFLDLRSGIVTYVANTNGSEINSYSKNIFVSNYQELINALQNATGGEIISMGAGDYGALKLNKSSQPFSQFDTEVIMQAAGAPGSVSFSGLELNGVENLTIKGVTFDYTAKLGAAEWERPFQIVSSNKIIIAESVFNGDLGRGVSSAGEGFGTGWGLYVGSSSNVNLTKNHFFEFNRALVVSDTTDLIVSANEVERIRSDGFNFANVDNVLIEKNYMHDFRGSIESGDHLDMIQFWTTGTTSPSTNVTIRENILNSQNGSWTQSIFMRNEAVDVGGAGADMFYKNILIEDNIIHNAHIHGITVGETEGLIIRNNTLLHNVDSGNDGTISVPAINVAANSQKVVITSNILPRVVQNGSAEWQIDRNVVVQRTDPNGDYYYGDLFFNGIGAGEARLDDLYVIPGSTVEQLHIGSKLSRMDMTPDQPLGFIASESGSGLHSLLHKFDASNVYGPNGAIDLTGAKVVWDFGDGQEASGVNAAHSFAESGKYAVKATITLPDQRQVVIDKTIVAQSPAIVKAAFSSGSEAMSAALVPEALIGGAALEQFGNEQSVRMNSGSVIFGRDPSTINNNEYTLLLDFKKDPGAENSGGRLFYFSSSFNASSGADSISLQLISSKGNSYLSASGIGINDSEWHQVAVTFSGRTGEAVLYVDGREVAKVGGLSGAIQTGSRFNDLYLGDPWGGSFKGLVDNFAFLKGAITAEQAAMLAANPGEGDLSNLSQLWSTGTATTQSVEKPVTITDSAAISEDSVSTVSGNVLANDSGENLAVTSINETAVSETGTTAILGKYGKLLISSDGAFTYAPDNAADAVNGLNAGETLTETFTYTVGNEGGVVSDTLSITINGVTDAPKIFNGTSKSETINGTVNVDHIFGRGGNDVLNGLAGNDEIYAEGGTDRISGGLGHDSLFGGGGNDTINGGDGNDRLNGDNGDDKLFGESGNDRLDGGANKDWLSGGEGADILLGGLGVDTLYGDAGDDRLGGGLGNDTLFGGEGRDILIGGGGADKFYGGANADIFVFGNDRNKDRIYDYVDGIDKLSLSGTGFGFGDLIITKSNGSAVLKNADGRVYMTIDGAAGLIDASDFVDVDLAFLN
jgi:VCBS repeat-containing protein